MAQPAVQQNSLSGQYSQQAVNHLIAVCTGNSCSPDKLDRENIVNIYILIKRILAKVYKHL